MNQLVLTLALWVAYPATAAWAHGGHGLGGGHWHATDVLGFVGLAAALALGWFMTRK